MINATVNLLVNALQAMDGQSAPRHLAISAGMCEVHPALQAADAFLEIGDAGPGLAAEVLDRLFTPVSTTKATGTGLGLIVARSLIQDHGGTFTGTNRGGANAVQYSRCTCLLSSKPRTHHTLSRFPYA